MKIVLKNNNTKIKIIYDIEFNIYYTWNIFINYKYWYIKLNNLKTINLNFDCDT